MCKLQEEMIRSYQTKHESELPVALCAMIAHAEWRTTHTRKLNYKVTERFDFSELCYVLSVLLGENEEYNKN